MLILWQGNRVYRSLNCIIHIVSSNKLTIHALFYFAVLTELINIESGAVKMRSSISWYFLHDSNDSSRLQLPRVDSKLINFPSKDNIWF